MKQKILCVLNLIAYTSPLKSKRHLPLVRYVLQSDLPIHVNTSMYQSKSVPSKNIFDNLPSLTTHQVSELYDELERYLGTDPEDVQDVLLWWYEHKHIYPRLYRMALNYLSIPRNCLTLLS
jgi:hypothetical protein